MTVEEVARSVLAAVASDAGHLLAAKWVADRYRQLASRTRFRHLRQIGELHIPAAISDGTATFTRGSQIVTGNDTARASWDVNITKRHIRARTVWYEIAGFDGTVIRLTTPFAEDDSTGSYRLVPRYLSLDPAVRWIGNDMVSMRRRRPVKALSLAELNQLAPERARIAAGPEIWTEIGGGENLDGERTRLVEPYPYATDSEVLHYVFWAEPATLAFRDSIPTAIDPHVLREGALIDAMRYEAARAMRAGGLEAAAYWRNEYRAQSTVWERHVMEAIRADKGVDDVTFILQRAGWTAIDRDITTALDEVLARWPR